jgi:subtilisin family serine protease
MLKMLRSIWASLFRSGSTNVGAPEMPRTRQSPKGAVAVTLLLLIVGPLMPTVLFPFGQQEAIAAPPAARSDDGQPRYVPGEVLVRFADGTTDAEMNSIHAGHGSWDVKKFQHVRNLHHVKLGPGVGVKQAIERYRRNPRVLYAEPNWIVRAVAAPNDANFGQLWGLNNTGQSGGIAGADIQATSAWDLTKGSQSVVVAVIDSGVDYNHQDLISNIYSGDCTGPGVDSDGNGYVNDCHGWNVLSNNGNPMDDNGHGTHVSGTIGAAGNNGVGVAGVNWQVKIMACKFLDSAGNGSTADAITCLGYVAAQKAKGVNIVATNNSWGGDFFSQALMDAIDNQRAMGILFIAAAGNFTRDNDVTPFYPASYVLPNVISVAATGASDELAGFSNWGRNTVHLGAPGNSILSTTPGNTYSYMSGTSMATPHVTGVAALLKAYNSGLTWIPIRNRILAGGENIPSLAGNTITGKRLNAYTALTCSNSVAVARVQPVGSVVAAGAGSPVSLQALQFNCGTPQSVTVNVHRDSNPPATLSPVTLTDASGTGVYSAQWSPPDYGSYTLTFPNSDTVTFPNGDAVRVDVPHPYGPPSSASYAWRTITGTNLNLGDDTSASVTPGFKIQFGGLAYDTVYVSSNGTLNFAADFIDYFNTSLPASGVSTLVAPYWDDLLSDTSTAPPHNVFWAVEGTAPNRDLVIEWRDVWRYSCTGAADTVKFQVVLFEGKSDVLFNYADVVMSSSCAVDGPPTINPSYGASATVGVQTGPSAASTFSYDSPSLTNSKALLWTAVASTPDFSISASPPSLTMTQGGTGTSTITVAASGGFAGSVGLTVSGCPTNATCSFSPQTVTSGGTSTLTVSTTNSTSTGAFTLNVTGTSGALNHATAVSLTVNPATTPDFSISANPTSLTLTQGGTGTSTVTVAASGGFSGNVALAYSGCPTGASCSLSPSLVTSSGTSTLTVSTTSSTNTGTFPVTVTGTSGSLSHATTVSITVNTPTTTTITFTSVASQDGYVLESGQNTNVGGSTSSGSSSSSALRVGDDSGNRQYKSIVSFNTSSIPDGATILSATLRLRRGTLSGTNPFTTHGTLWADAQTGGFSGSTSLQRSDFQAAATAVGVASLSDAGSNLGWSEGSLSAAGLLAVNKTGTTQFRVYFNLGNNNDLGSDYVGYYSGENSTAANRPQLVVTYR